MCGEFQNVETLAFPTAVSYMPPSCSDFSLGFMLDQRGTGAHTSHPQLFADKDSLAREVKDGCKGVMMKMWLAQIAARKSS